MNNTWHLDPEVKAEWIEALTSGEFKQGKSYLETVNGRMCCLGVLTCVLSGKRPRQLVSHEGVVRMPIDNNFIWNHFTKMGIITLPFSHLANMNDKGKTFSTIATWIDINL